MNPTPPPRPLAVPDGFVEGRPWKVNVFENGTIEVLLGENTDTLSPFRLVASTPEGLRQFGALVSRLIEAHVSTAAKDFWGRL